MAVKLLKEGKYEALRYDYIGKPLKKFLQLIKYGDKIFIAISSLDIPSFSGRVNQVTWIYADLEIKDLRFDEKNDMWEVEI